MNPPVRTGLILALLHTLVAICLYFAAKGNAGVAQGQFVWFFLLLPDLLAVELGDTLLGNWLSNIESNMGMLIVIGIFGGVQWFLIGMLSHIILSKHLAGNGSTKDGKAT